MGLDKTIINVSRDEVGAVFDDLETLIAEGSIQAALAQQGADIPIVDSTFAPVFRQGKRGRIFVTLRFTGYGTADDIKIVIVSRAEILTEDDWNQKRVTGKLGDKIPAGTLTWVSEIDIALDPLTQYDIIGLVALAAGDDRARNPTPDPFYAPTGTDPGYPANAVFTLTTPAQAPEAGTPGKPTLARVIANAMDEFGDGTLGFLTIRFFADETELKTFAEQGMVDTQIRLNKVAGGHQQYSLLVTDPSATFIDYTVGDQEVGAAYDHVKNVGFDSSGQPSVALATSTVRVIIGGFRDSDALSLLSLTSLNTIPKTGGTALKLKWTLDQPGPAWPGDGPYRLLSYFVEVKDDGADDSTYVEVIEERDIRAPRYNRVGEVHINHTVDVAPGASYNYRMTVIAFGGVAKQFLSGTVSSSGGVVPIVQAPSKPTAGRIITNTIAATGNGLQPIVVLKIFANEAESATFAAQNQGGIQAKLTKIVGSTVVTPSAFVTVPTDTFLTLAIGPLLDAGFKYEWNSNAGVNGAGAAIAPSTSTITFFAGGFADPSDSLAGMSLTSVNGVSFDDATQIRLTWILVQPNPPYPLFSFYVERKLSSEADSAYNVVIEPTDVQAPVYNTAGNITFIHVVPARPTKTYNYRMTMTSIGGFTKQFTSGNISS